MSITPSLEGSQMDMSHAIIPAQALVARADVGHDHVDQYLLITPAGQQAWVADPAAATPFPSMREAMRMALRLPAPLRAFGLPRETELALRAVH
jgi:hypothetical protein